MYRSFKKCYACERELAIKEFPKNRSKIDQHSDECGDCTRERNRAYYENNRERIAAKRRARKAVAA